MLDETQQLKLYQEVLLKINDIITADHLSVGDRLPSERELAERLNVGRSSVREALRALELLGLISTRRGEGTFIQDYTSHRLVEILAFYVLSEQRSKKDLLEMRTIIELDAVRLAAMRMSEEELNKMEQLLIQSEGKMKHGQLPVEEDYLFHQMIAKGSGNYLLYRVWRPVFDYGRTVLESSLNRYGRPEVSIQEHRQIFQALREKKVSEAERTMKLHLEKSEFFA